MNNSGKVNREWVDFSEKIVYLEDIFFPRSQTVRLCKNFIS